MEINLLQVLLGAVLSACIGAFLGWIGSFILNNNKRFNGWWDVRIEWTPDWGKKLVDKDCDECFSRGKALISSGFGSSRRNFKGLSYWELIVDEVKKSELCVEFVKMEFQRPFFRKEFPFFLFGVKSFLKQFQLDAKFRKKYGDFEYKPFLNYTIKIDVCRSDRLTGSVEVDDVVGTFSADKIG